MTPLLGTALAGTGGRCCIVGARDPLYPLLSALPQELVFRPLFFRRYGHLFPDGRIALLANGALFGLAHLMFWNWPAVLLSTAGGLIFAHAYARRGSFALAKRVVSAMRLSLKMILARGRGRLAMLQAALAEALRRSG